MSDPLTSGRRHTLHDLLSALGIVVVLAPAAWVALELGHRVRVVERLHPHLSLP